MWAREQEDYDGDDGMEKLIAGGRLSVRMGNDMRMAKEWEFFSDLLFLRGE